MHHLVQCNCSNSSKLHTIKHIHLNCIKIKSVSIFKDNFMIPNFATYSNCKILEFKILSFYKMLYNMLQRNEKDDYWYKTYMIYKRETHKCDECGGGSFLKTFSRNLSNKVKKYILYYFSFLLFYYYFFHNIFLLLRIFCTIHFIFYYKQSSSIFCQVCCIIIADYNY